jgi:hypothetical protein
MPTKGALPLNVAVVVLLGFAFTGASVRVSSPLSAYPANAHYFLFRGKATVLVTSGEHYGGVINRDFNYVPYLDELQRNHLNLTRIWAGPYREVAGSFNIADNTLAPKPGSFVAPWIRSKAHGAADGLNRFDLKRWNPAYFLRLHDFIQQAARRGIVVEVNLFCPYYEQSMWQVSPLNARNNVNAIGNVSRTEALTMRNPRLLAVQDAMVRKIVTELNPFDNVYYEICNEPYFGGVTLDWQQHISAVVASTEEHLPHRHLISQNVSNGSVLVEIPLPNVSILNFHYSRPPDSVTMNYSLDRAIGNNETGFDGQADAIYRIQGWDFLVAGGALYNNLDYSFTVGHESGDFRYSSKTPGGGSPALRKQLGILKNLFDSMDLTGMRPSDSLAKSTGAAPASMRVLASPDNYIVYIHEGRIKPDSTPKYVVDASPHKRSLSLNLPAGIYEQTWINTKTGVTENESRVRHPGGERVFQSPTYSEDTALTVRRIPAERPAPTR